MSLYLLARTTRLRTQTFLRGLWLRLCCSTLSKPFHYTRSSQGLRVLMRACLCVCVVLGATGLVGLEQGPAVFAQGAGDEPRT